MWSFFKQDGSNLEGLLSFASGVGLKPHFILLGDPHREQEEGAKKSHRDEH
jgi:hypothetical protein